MIMLIGLPGCGKSTWVENHVAEYPEKRYNIIGASALVERMKVNIKAQCGKKMKISGISTQCHFSSIIYFCLVGEWRTT